MQTEKLYYTEPYRDTCTATVQECAKTGRGYEILLDRTVFYPEGGGQPADTGEINGLQVLDVQERGEEVIHLLPSPLPCGDEAVCRVDWARRFDFMQQHSGEHIVSGLVHSRHGYDNVGFHMGHDVVTIDFNGVLESGELEEIERLANEAVWKNLRIDCSWPTPEQLLEIPYRSKKALTGSVRIVTVPGYDICACCGLHVCSTGEIGLIKFLSCQKFRDGVRVEMLCGHRAFTHIQEIYRANRDTAVLLSARPAETAQAAGRILTELSAVKYQASVWRTRAFEEKASRFADAGDLLLFEEKLNSEELRHLTTMVMTSCGGRCAVFSGTEEQGYKYALGSENGDIRDLTKAMNAALSGRGGGRDMGFAQGSVQAHRADIEAFFASEFQV